MLHMRPQELCRTGRQKKCGAEASSPPVQGHAAEVPCAEAYTPQPRTSFFFCRMDTVGAQYVLSGSGLVLCRQGRGKKCQEQRAKLSAVLRQVCTGRTEQAGERQQGGCIASSSPHQCAP